MGRSLGQVLAKLPPAQRAQVRKRTRDLVTEEMSLRALRRALGQTQARIAADLGVGQDTVSRYERRADMLLSTLQGYIQAMGGRLTLVAEFPRRPPVRIKALAEIAPPER